MKRTRLKKKISECLILMIVVVFLFALFAIAWIRYEETAQECDKARGYICTHYDVRQYTIKGE